LQRRDTPWSQDLVVLGADRRSIAWFTAALTVPAVLLASAVAAVAVLGLWQVQVYSFVFGGQVLGPLALVARCWWAVPFGWLVILCSSVLPTGREAASSRRRGLRVIGGLAVVCVAALVALGWAGVFDNTVKLFVLYLVILVLIGATPIVLRALARLVMPGMLHRRPSQLFLVPWRGVLGNLAGFARSATPLLAGSLLVTVAFASGQVVRDVHGQFLRRAVDSGPLGPGFRADVERSSFPPANQGLVTVEGLRISPGAALGNALSASCPELSAAMGMELPCDAPGMQFSSDDFVPTPLQVPSPAGGTVDIAAIGDVDAAVGTLFGVDLFVFEPWTRETALASWGKGADVTETIIVGGEPEAVQRARTFVLTRVPTARLDSARAEMSLGADRYQRMQRRLMAVGVMVAVSLAAGQLVGTAARRRNDQAVEDGSAMLGAPLHAARKWQTVRHLTDLALILVSSALLVGVLGLAAAAMGFLTEPAGFAMGYLVTAAALALVCAVQLAILWAPRRTGH
jgi:hypothetical protein